MRRTSKKLFAAVTAMVIAICMAVPAYAVIGSVPIYPEVPTSAIIRGESRYGITQGTYNLQDATATTSMDYGFCTLFVSCTCFFYNNMGVVSLNTLNATNQWYSVTVTPKSSEFTACGVSSYHSATDPSGRGNGFGLSEGITF